MTKTLKAPLLGDFYGFSEAPAGSTLLHVKWTQNGPKTCFGHILGYTKAFYVVFVVKIYVFEGA